MRVRIRRFTKLDEDKNSVRLSSSGPGTESQALPRALFIGQEFQFPRPVYRALLFVDFELQPILQELTDTAHDPLSRPAVPRGFTTSSRGQAPSGEI